jgi:hypothetical protein
MGRVPGSPAGAGEDTLTAREHYRREKARRARQSPSQADLIADARREYEALLQAEAARGKGGRPKKTATQRSEPRDVEAPDELADAAGAEGADVDKEKSEDEAPEE